MVKNWPSHLVHGVSTRLKGAFLAVGVLAVGIGVISTPVAAANAQGPTTQSFSQIAQLTPSGYGENQSTCAIQSVGWVICPVMRSIAKLADYGFAFINQNFLKIEYGISNTDSGIYKAWELMRTIANALFVLAFMAIVYAQISGRSAGGYNIKRMLPRLIIGAILVNISYYVCVIGIELSNIVGGSILSMMQGVSNSIGPAAMTLSSAENGFNDSRLTDITNAILQKTNTVWILLAPVAAVTVSIALICAAGLVLLIMRKVVVAMLVLISPLMFVTYLLPNTEKYFQQWLRLFFQLLLLYPVIAFLLGTGQIVSSTIINVGSGTDSNYRVMGDGYRTLNGGSGSATTDLAAAGAAVLPLLGTWFLMKSLSSVITNTGSKVAGNIGRGRSKNEEARIKAKMEGKAKQAIAGNGLPTYDRKPAFSRLRRRRGAAALADTLPTKGSSGKVGTATGGKPASLIDRAMGNVNADKAATENGEAGGGSAALENATPVDTNADRLGASLSLGADKDDKKSAKDIFNNLNKTHQIDDKKSSSGAGGGSAGDSSDNASTSTPQPITPGSANSLQTQAPATPAAQPQTLQQIVAIPVEAVDASTFIKKDPAVSAAAANPTMPSLPSSEVEKKATARAQKYLFDSQDAVDVSSARIDQIKKEAAKLKEAKQDDKDER